MNKLSIFVVAIAVIVMMVVVIQIQPVQAKEKETILRFPLYVSLWSDDEDVGKVKITGYFMDDKVSYNIDYKSFHKKYVKAFLLFKPQPRGIFDWYKVCISNPATDETECKTGWWYPGWSYAQMTIEIPAHYYQHEDFE